VELGARDAALSIVIVPRERYSDQVDGIAALSALPGPPVSVVVVDEARCPRRVRARTAQLARDKGFTHVHLDRRAGANDCRMAGFELVNTPWTLFIDNDARLEPGAIEALLRRAEDTDASFVAPVCVNANRTIHFAGSVARVVGCDGRHDLVEIRPHGHPPAEEMAPLIDAAPTDAPELHGVLVRTASLRSVGGMDTQLDAAMDCLDLGFRLQDVDGGGWLEPGALVAYRDPRPRLTDLPLYLDRWSRATIGHDIDRFAEVWHIDPASPRLLQHWDSLGDRRFRPVRYVRGAVRRTLGAGARAKLDAALDAMLERTSVITRRR
jgi:GT2 family glycosyltransferase